MKALLDINLLLDVALNRQPWAISALALCEACADGKLDGYVAGMTPPTLFYVVRRNADLEKAKEAVELCLESFEILPVDRAALEMAHSIPSSDFEDNVQIACAMLGGMDWIVTRDKKLSHPGIQVVDATAVMALL